MAAAWASGTDKEPRHYTAADQALARSIVIKLSDLGSTTLWHGGARKPDTSAEPTCPNFNPRQSDIVITGDAESVFEYTAAAVQYDSEAQVLRTANMVQLDWQRSVKQPTLLPCLRSILTKSLSSSEHLVSMAKITVPQIATFTAEYRIVIDVRSASPPETIRTMIDELLIGRNRTELSLTTSAPYSARVPIQKSELRLARLLASRIPTSA